MRRSAPKTSQIRSGGRIWRTDERSWIAINYARDPRLRNRTVLRPGWLADGIYALLRANTL